MKSIFLAVLTVLRVSSAVAATGTSVRDAGALISLDGAPVQGTLTAEGTDWYHLDVNASSEEQIVAIVDRGDLLLCVVDENTGAETGTFVTPAKPGILPLREGRYRVSLRTTTTTVYEIFLLPVPDRDNPPLSPTSVADNRVPQWPEREVPELVRSAEGILGRKWAQDSRSYELDVAAGYRAELTVECRSGAFEAMAIATSGTIVSLLLPGHVENTVRLGAGQYHVYLIAHADESEYELTVKMRRGPPPKAR